MTTLDAHRDPGADPAREWVHPMLANNTTGPTADDWRQVADLLDANADRFPDQDLTEVIVLCRSESNRLDREAAHDKFVEELARKFYAKEVSFFGVVGVDYPHWEDREPRYREGSIAGVRTILDDLGLRLMSAEELELLRTACRTSDDVERVNALVQLGCRFGIEKPVKATLALPTELPGLGRNNSNNSANNSANEPAPRSWPSLDQVPHDVVEVEDCDGDRMVLECGRWCWPSTGNPVEHPDVWAPFTEVSA